MLGVAVRDAVPAVADNQLPRLELGDPAYRLGVAGYQDERSEQDQAKSSGREGQGSKTEDRADCLGYAEIAAVLQQRTKMLIFEPVFQSMLVEGPGAVEVALPDLWPSVANE